MAGFLVNLLMLPLGHVSASYLISQIPRGKYETVRLKEVVFIIFCGNIFDFDFFLPNILGMPSGTHHYLPTHTPLAGIIYWLGLYILLRKIMSFRTLLLGGIAMLSHLVLDDLSYWLTLLGWERQFKPQIFWFYPFDGRLQEGLNEFYAYYNNNPYTAEQFYARYLSRLPALFFLEVLLAIAAAFVAVKKKAAEIQGAGKIPA